MGHYVLKHLWTGIAFSIAITFLGSWIATIVVIQRVWIRAL
jgi:hypothetical protein